MNTDFLCHWMKCYGVRSRNTIASVKNRQSTLSAWKTHNGSQVPYRNLTSFLLFLVRITAQVPKEGETPPLFLLHLIRLQPGFCHIHFKEIALSRSPMFLLLNPASSLLRSSTFNTSGHCLLGNLHYGFHDHLLHPSLCQTVFFVSLSDSSLASNSIKANAPYINTWFP